MVQVHGFLFESLLQGSECSSRGVFVIQMAENIAIIWFNATSVTVFTRRLVSMKLKNAALLLPII